MDYEQKYKEALERVRKLYNDAKANEYKSDMEDYESIFPELAESEDERIRRWLCDYFSSIDKAWIHKDITCIDILRWLEKQKEQNLIMANSPQLKEQKQEKFPPYVTGFKGHPDPAGTSDLEKAAKEYASKTLCDPDDGPSTGLAKESFIAGAEWQKEQKPIAESKKLANEVIEYLIRCGYSPVLKDDSKKEHFHIDIPRHEDDFWHSEEYKHCCSVLGEYYMEGDYGGDTYTLYVWRTKKEQKPAEWSEEDEKDMAHIIRILDDCYVYGTHDLSKTDHENLVNKLKSLRPSWKPNEEQMKALNEIVNILAASPFLHQNDYLFNILNGLREELKKLL